MRFEQRNKRRTQMYQVDSMVTDFKDEDEDECQDHPKWIKRELLSTTSAATTAVTTTTNTPTATTTISTTVTTTTVTTTPVTEVCILHELSFGNVPLGPNIINTLAAIPTPGEPAPRQNVRFDPPPYATVRIRKTKLREAALAVSEVANRQPNLLRRP